MRCPTESFKFEMPIVIMALPEEHVEALTKLAYCALYGSGIGLTIHKMFPESSYYERVARVLGVDPAQAELIINNMNYHGFFDEDGDLCVPERIRSKDGSYFEPDPSFFRRGYVTIEEDEDDQ